MIDRNIKSKNLWYIGYASIKKSLKLIYLYHLVWSIDNYNAELYKLSCALLWVVRVSSFLIKCYCTQGLLRKQIIEESAKKKNNTAARDWFKRDQDLDKEAVPNGMSHLNI